MVKGENPDNNFHIWLEDGSFIIDLTSHQFEGFHSPLILINKDDYILNKSPYYSKTGVYTYEEDWPYFENLAPEFIERFYSKY